MEMANPRHAHEYKVYREMPLPDDMLLVAGVIDTKTNYVEHPEVVADRLRQAVAATGGDPKRVLAGTDCGFDTSAGSNRVDRGVVWLKLARDAGGRRPRQPGAVLGADYHFPCLPGLASFHTLSSTVCIIQSWGVISSSSAKSVTVWWSLGPSFKFISPE